MVQWGQAGLVRLRQSLWSRRSPHPPLPFFSFTFFLTTPFTTASLGKEARKFFFFFELPVFLF